MPLVALHQATGIEETTLANMRLLSQILRRPKQEVPTEESTEIPNEEPTEVPTNLKNMLAGMIGDMSLNRQLTALGQMSARETEIDTMTIAGLKDLSYRTRHLNEIDAVLNDILLRIERAQRGQTLEEAEKITLKQYGILHDLATLNSTLNNYNEKGLITGNEQLERLHHCSNNAVQIIGHLDKTFNERFIMPTGAVIFDDTKKKAQVYGKTLSFFEQSIAFFVTKYGHTAKGVYTKTGEIQENKMSHINPDYKQDNYSLRNYLYSDIYQINLNNLIDPSAKRLLEARYQENWLTSVQEKFDAIEKRIHAGNLGAHRHVTSEGSTARYAQIATTKAQGGHKNLFYNDHTNADIRDDILGENKWAGEQRGVSRVLCSEFIGKTIIASIQELNTILREELGSNAPPTPIIKNPISEKEKLHLLTPQRLLIAMQKRGAIEQVETSPELSKVMAIRDPRQIQNLRAQLQEDRKSEHHSLDNTKELEQLNTLNPLQR